VRLRALRNRRHARKSHWKIKWLKAVGWARVEHREKERLAVGILIALLATRAQHFLTTLDHSLTSESIYLKL